MGLLANLFKKKSTNDDVNLITHEEPDKRSVSDEWKAVPGFIPTSPDEYVKVSLIASSIAIGDYPNSEFIVKKIYKRNPEVQTVSIIAASLASDYVGDDRQVRVTNIYKKIGG